VNRKSVNMRWATFWDGFVGVDFDVIFFGGWWWSLRYIWGGGWFCTHGTGEIGWFAVLFVWSFASVTILELTQWISITVFVGAYSQKLFERRVLAVNCTVHTQNWNISHECYCQMSWSAEHNAGCELYSSHTKLKY
jgi:hypothetical protein